MTRENKLALVVGFGLILFVGILISDHFSVVRTQQAAKLTEVLDPLVATVVEPVSFVDLIQPKPEPAPTEQLQEVPNAAQASNVQPPTGSGATTEPASPSSAQPNIVLGESTDSAGEMLNNPPPGFDRVENPEAQAAFVFHEVAEGETLYSICRDQLGNVGSLQALADFNNLDDPGSLSIGQRIRIPKDVGAPSSTEVQRSEKSTTESAKPIIKPANKPKAKVTYTVRKGDTLRVIAKRMTGSKENWQKIYDMNKDVIGDPDNVKVGTVLRIS